jgi:hypothetical protein
VRTPLTPAQRAAVLVAVSRVWASTGFEVTMLGVERAYAKAITVTVIGLQGSSR